MFLYPCSEYSMQLNASCIKVLQAQDDVVNITKEAAAKELLNVSHHGFRNFLKDVNDGVTEEAKELLHLSHDHPAYKNLLKELVVQVTEMDSIP